MPRRGPARRGALTDAVAIAAVRATREAEVRRGRDRLPAIIGTPIAGETSGTETFDGATEVATFPGDLPEDVEALLGKRGRLSRPERRFARQYRLPLPALSPAGARDAGWRRAGAAPYSS